MSRLSTNMCYVDYNNAIKIAPTGGRRKAHEILAVANRAKRVRERTSRINRWNRVRPIVLGQNLWYSELADMVGNGCNRRIIEKWVNGRTVPIAKHLDQLELIAVHFNMQGNK